MRAIRLAIASTVLIAAALLATLNAEYDVVRPDAAPVATLREHLLHSLWYTTICIGLATLAKMVIVTYADAVAGRDRVSRIIALVVLEVFFVAVPGGLLIKYNGLNSLLIATIVGLALLGAVALLRIGNSIRTSASYQKMWDVPQEVMDESDRSFLHEVIRPLLPTIAQLILWTFLLGSLSYFLIELQVLLYQWPSPMESLLDAASLVGALSMCYTIMVRWMRYVAWNNQLEGITLLTLLSLVGIIAFPVCWFIYPSLDMAAVMWILGGFVFTLGTFTAPNIMKSYLAAESARGSTASHNNTF